MLSKMRQTIWLAVLVGGLSSGCATIGRGQEPKIEGELCTHAARSGLALCSTIQTGQTAPSVPIGQTDKWIMVSPRTWESIQNALDWLRRHQQAGGYSIMAVPDEMGVSGRQEPGYWVPSRDIGRAAGHLEKLRQSTLRRR